MVESVVMISGVPEMIAVTMESTTEVSMMMAMVKRNFGRHSLKRKGNNNLWDKRHVPSARSGNSVGGHLSQ
ncbi:Protein of unknown function [Gryllus bimaculatus]|nr:Protein of unknown function [Gryllus bimaculatus]